MANSENLSPQVIRDVASQLMNLRKSPPEGVQIFVDESNLTDIQASIEGPLGTPYEGGIFKMKLVLGKDFPQSPPKGFFLTKIFHPNVAKNGEICVNTLKRDWKPELGIKHILLTVKCLLIVPNPESALNEEAGKLLLDHYDDYFQQAKMMTEIHALRPKTFYPGTQKSECGKEKTALSELCTSKKRPLEKSDKKKLEKKRALKRL